MYNRKMTYQVVRDSGYNNNHIVLFFDELIFKNEHGCDKLNREKTQT